MSIPTPSQLPETVNVLIATGVPDRRIDQIKAVSPRLNVVNVYGDIVPLMANDWPERSMKRLTANAPEPSLPPEELDRLIRNTHVLVIGHPYPMHLKPSPQQAFWVHNIRAGATLIEQSDFWRGPTFTISRGYSNALQVAETAFSAALMFAKRLDFAVRNTAAGNTLEGQPQLRLIQGKTMGVWGLGGIGSHVARLSKAVGMRVIALRRSATQRQADVDGVDELFPPSDLHEFLAQSDFVAICLNLTKETTLILGAPELEAMKDTAFLLNISRGELIDEPALIEALETGRIAGALHRHVDGRDQPAATAGAAGSAQPRVYAAHLQPRRRARRRGRHRPAVREPAPHVRGRRATQRVRLGPGLLGLTATLPPPRGTPAPARSALCRHAASPATSRWRRARR